MHEDFIAALDIEIDYYRSCNYKLSIAQLYHRVNADLSTDMSLRQFSRKLRDLARDDAFDWQNVIDFNSAAIVSPSPGPRRYLRRAANQYVMDLWRNQPRRVEVIADFCLSGVVATVCKKWAVTATAIKSTADPAINAVLARVDDSEKPVLLLYLGDNYDSLRQRCGQEVCTLPVCPSPKQVQAFGLGPKRGCAAINPDDVGNVLDKRLSQFVEDRKDYNKLLKQQVFDFKKMRDFADVYARVKIPKEALRKDIVPDTDTL